MLSTAIVPADSVQPARYFLDILETPVTLTALRLTLAALALLLGGMYLYARKKAREEAREDREPNRS